jgi:hypothetical protein
MWETIMKYASESGIWAILFVALFSVQIKESKTREAKYQVTIDTLVDKLKLISDIKESVDEIIEMINNTDK